MLDLYPVNRIDSSALHAVSKLHETLVDQGIQLLLSGVKGPVRDALDKSGLSQRLGSKAFFQRIHDAKVHATTLVNAYLSSTHAP